MHKGMGGSILQQRLITTKQRLRELLNLLSFKLDHKDYVAAFTLIYNLRLGNSSSEEMIEIFKEVSRIEHEFSNYSTYEVIQGNKKSK